MRKVRPVRRATPEARRDAIRVADALVRAGYCTLAVAAEALEFVARGDYDGADRIIAVAAAERRRASGRKR